MSFRFLLKTTLTLFTCSIFMSAAPLPGREHAIKTKPRLQIERIIARNLFVVPLCSANTYQRLFSPSGILSSGDPKCWGEMTKDNLLGMGYPSQTAEWVGGAAMRNYPGLDPTVEYAMEQGVSFEDICKVLANCMVNCGWE